MTEAELKPIFDSWKNDISSLNPNEFARAYTITLDHIIATWPEAREGEALYKKKGWKRSEQRLVDDYLTVVSAVTLFYKTAAHAPKTSDEEDVKRIFWIMLVKLQEARLARQK